MPCETYQSTSLLIEIVVDSHFEEDVQGQSVAELPSSTSSLRTSNPPCYHHVIVTGKSDFSEVHVIEGDGLLAPSIFRWTSGVLFPSRLFGSSCRWASHDHIDDSLRWVRLSGPIVAMSVLRLLDSCSLFLGLFLSKEPPQMALSD